MHPESASIRNRSGIRVRSTRNLGDAGTIFGNPGDCKGIADSMQSDCNRPQSTHSNSIAIGLQKCKGLQGDRRDCTKIHEQPARQSRCKSRCHCDAIHHFRLQSTKSNWIATRLPGDRRIAPKSWEIPKLQENISNRPRIGILSQSVRDPSNLLQIIGLPHRFRFHPANLP